MTEAPVGPLRRRMIDDMTLRKFAPRTQEGYIRAIKGFSAFLGASPDTARFEDLRRYQLHLVSSGAGVPTINHTLTALRFLFMVTLRKPAVVLDMPFVREPRRLPIVLSPEEVARLLDAAPGLVEGGAATGLAVPGARPGAAAHDTPAQPRLPCRGTDGRDREDRIPAHVEAQLRHASARAEDRHSRDPEPAPAKAGVLLGHKKLDTTALYTRVAIKALGEVTSPLEHLATKVTPPA